MPSYLASIDPQNGRSNEDQVIEVEMNTDQVTSSSQCALDAGPTETSDAERTMKNVGGRVSDPTTILVRDINNTADVA
jgi:hypothetical protein